MHRFRVTVAYCAVSPGTGEAAGWLRAAKPERENRLIGESMNTETSISPAVHEPAVVAVNAETLRDLHDTYTLYRQALAEPGDPMRVLTMTGDVLAAVRRVVTDSALRVRR
ncbi:hypothetical protein [Arthrobacter bambusae]|uniref:Uncharacterized protein n=1 Tax=Arthrobacter bambusae TaxID=1338426 RepID=A0AAW8DG49_9MICC|nr:hypothetical protein [Arthrobacter bambusae]MDP9904622.1 hypothetical protein [Arthrobacter bambusae]MDQ0129438.1 hypothetical protein [Arthrobacter bambusae]MDQ0180949.1 hypothetical protein [Arthrobacter bambusae]